MRGPIALLFCVSGFRFGGFFTFTEHLYRSFRQQGYEPQLLRLTQRTETRLRPFRGDVLYQNMALADALALVCTMPSLICCAYLRGDMLTAVPALLRAGAGIVLHDPTEMTSDMLQILKHLRIQPVVIRKINCQTLATHGILAHHIPHPYVRMPRDRPFQAWYQRPAHALALSRIDFDKHTDVIIQANTLLPSHRACRIYGEENRIYTHHTLDAKYAGWRQWYKGSFPAVPWAGVALAAQARYIVDMSQIKRDGGGTQYTFLEAWDAGASLIVHSKWLIPGGTIQNDVNALAVENAEQLAAVLRDGADTPALHQAGEAILRAHAPQQVIPAYAAYFAGRKSF